MKSMLIKSYASIVYDDMKPIILSMSMNGKMKVFGFHMSAPAVFDRILYKGLNA